MAGEDNTSHISSVLDGGGAWNTTPQGQSGALPKLVMERAQSHLESQAAAMHSAAPSGGPAAPGSGGGYHFDPETIAQRIKDWQQVLDDITADRLELENAKRYANAPSPDKPALRNAEATRNSIDAAIDQNMAMQQYAQAWLDALRKANGTYVEHDQDTGKGLSGAGSVTDGSALNS